MHRKLNSNGLLTYLLNFVPRMTATSGQKDERWDMHVSRQVSSKFSIFIGSIIFDEFECFMLLRYEHLMFLSITLYVYAKKLRGGGGIADFKLSGREVDERLKGSRCGQKQPL